MTNVDSAPTQNVTKLNAASRQLREAILLFFEQRDTIAIHTLVAAAHEVLTDIAKKSNLVSMIKSNPLLLPDKKKEWLAVMSEAENFFKHADRDPNHILEFRPSLTQFFLIDAIQMYKAVTGKIPREHNIFAAWFNLTYPTLISNPELKSAIDHAIDSGINPNDFSIILELLRNN